MKTKPSPCSNSPGRRFNGLILIAAATLAAAPCARADYQSTVLSDSPLAYYPLNLAVDTSGTATDASGNGNDGAYVNISSGVNITNGPSGFITNAVHFDGTDTYVDLSSAPNLNLAGPAALEVWVQPADSTSFGDILGKGYDSSTSQEIVLRVNGPYGANYYANFGSAGVSGGQQNTNWMHVVLSNDGTATRLYINGMLVQVTGDSTGAISFGDPWAIGNGSSAGYGRFFNGNIAQVAFYNYGLTGSQILNHYFAGMVGATPGNYRPLITAQPQPMAVYAGGSARFSVSALSSLPLTYQWYRGAALMSGETNRALTVANVQSGGATNYSVMVGNSNGTTNSMAAALTVLTPGNPLQWSATGSSGAWDTGSSADWINLNTSLQTVFNASDSVLFDDTPGVSLGVSVNDNVAPSVLAVAASANNFTFSGSGSITGAGSLVKTGNSTLALNVPGNFTGPVLVGGGTLKTVGNNTLGAVSAIVVSNGATLDFDGQTMSGGQPIIVSGNGVANEGALFSSSGGIYGNIVNITLAGDTLFGAANRWDLGLGSSIQGPHHLTVDWSAGAGYGEWNSVNVGADITGIEVRSGTLGLKFMSFQNPSTTITVDSGSELPLWNGGLNGSLHVMSNGRVDLWQAPSALTGSTVMLESNSLWYSWGSSSSDQSINCAMVLNGISHFLIGDHNMVYTNLVSGPGGFVIENWNHQIVLSASNTYSGPTVIDDGPQVALVGDGSISHSSLIFFGGGNATSVHLDASARSDGTLTLASGQTLAGVGLVSGTLVASPGAVVAPAGTNTTLGINAGANVTGAIGATGDATLNGTTIIKLNGSGTNDSITSYGNVTYGGTLELVNVSGKPLAAGDSFQVFSGSGISGTFGTITPASPGPGLAWDWSQLGSGIVAVKGVPLITSVHLSAGSLVFGGAGGSANGTFYVITATNLMTPVINWTVLSTNTFDGTGNFNVTNPVSAGTPQRFYMIK